LLSTVQFEEEEVIGQDIILEQVVVFRALRGRERFVENQGRVR
jgi:hypothetical protein